MANISELLKKIKSARYGRDVRDSIHDAIQAMNTDIKNNVPTVQSLTERAEGASSSAKTYSTDASAAATNAKEYSDSAKRYSESAASAIAMAYDTEATAEKRIANTIEASMLVTNATVNLFSGMFVNQTHEGITYTSNGDGTYSVKGSLTGNSSSYTNSILVNVQKGKTYKVLGSKSTNISQVSVYKKDNATAITSSKGSGIFIADEDQINLCLYVPLHAEGIIDEILKPMLTTDLNATYDDFVPYSGYDIKTCGKNLLNPTLQTTTQNGVTCTNNGDGTYTLNGTATSHNAVFYIETNVDVQIGVHYKFAGCPKGGGNGKYSIEITDEIIHGVSDFGDGTDFIPKDTGNPYKVLLVVYMNQTVNNLIFRPMLTTDLTATYDDFEPYQDGGTVRIDSTTEFPLLGLKSFNGETNIISPGNVEVSHALTDTGKYVMQNMKDISDIKAAIVASGSTTE